MVVTAEPPAGRRVLCSVLIVRVRGGVAYEDLENREKYKDGKKSLDRFATLVILGWPKSLFGFFCSILNKLFANPVLYSVKYR